jgi:hypothetical protein
MKWQAYILITFAVTAAIGGVATAIMNSVMVNALNLGRPADDQIPAVIGSSRDLRWYLRNAPSPYWRVLMQFHLQFPESRLYFWSILTLTIMLIMFVAAGLSMLLTLTLH